MKFIFSLQDVVAKRSKSIHSRKIICFAKVFKFVLPFYLSSVVFSVDNLLTINILLFLKVRILGFYAIKSHNLIGQGIFHGDQDFFDL